MSDLNDPAFFDRYAHEYDDVHPLDPTPAVDFLAGLVPAYAHQFAKSG